ncbi:hypothetical protein [Fluviispira multicolorata]|uniref:Uncharacterized protein n=1 Tax=Fluviispira multicolorata TaxID=2654512 RepID=A0A833JFS4_9BACT|nr:hypothetical protein [Fluviispira multicolorata]KAB8031766.1 hypothetical protein GCL57_03760 [Fluviispira multicolorata]
MLPEIHNILEVFERMSLDNKAYLTFSNEENMQVCISYHKQTDQRNWSIWFSLNEEASRQTISVNHLQSVLKAFKVQEEFFIQELSGLLLLQAAFADEFIRQMTELFGKEKIQKSILATQNFMDELSIQMRKYIIEQDIENAAKSKNKKTFKIVK